MNEGMNIERAINRAIRNGNRIAENGLGTILPTRADLERAEKWHAESMAKHEERADIDLAELDKRTAGGELRYYLNPTTYCSVNVYGKRRWFETRNDGDYAIKPPCS